MSESLGLSIGMANLVAARAGGDAVTRRSVLTLFDQRTSEVGLPEENPDPADSGLVMRGFVERVGDRTPLVAADGTKYLGDALTVEALEAMARTVDYGTPVTIAVPAYWSPEQSAALREEFFAQPGLAPGGVPPALISDATAALTALRAEPDFPTDGIVALCDFGASGTTVTLSDAGSDFAQIGPSVRYREFSGDGIDQLILDRMRDVVPSDSSGGLAATSRMGSLTRLLDQYRTAKENLSTAPVTTVPAVTGEDIELSRNEFEELISGPLDEFVTALENILRHNEIPTTNLAAVATVGGGASIPLLATRLSERLGVPVHTAPQPAFTAALGAATFGLQHPSPGAVPSPPVDNATQLAPAVPADMTQAIPRARIEEEAPLAWSEDEDEEDPVPYTGPEHSGQYVRDAMGFEDADDEPYATEAPPWYKRPAVVLSLVAAGAAILVATILALTLGEENPRPVQTPPSQPTAPPPEQTVTITDTPTETVIAPPPPPTTTSQAPVTTTTEAPTTTYQPPTTTYQPPPTTTVPPPTTTFTPPLPTERERHWPWRRF
ncbi:Hsp70 family protein [Mycobacterium sp. Aquia_213]|uniref:Hsp70 family protein n=1 Tax=Mycobacterium sp. Aquia_213 TaxID=2991728 RepID=UPI00226E4D29|nr:Hsp70 family protein [Mycobacterium sp. Aquia_213]WAC91137.1 Hsp70 family protein [Mycobacterium sp. Aquia_213]